MSGFSIDWLDLREPADRRSRDRALHERAVRWLVGGGTPDHAPVIVDLGAGTGSTLRAFADSAPIRSHWRLVDHDNTLLAEACRRHGNTQRIEAFTADLSRVDALPLDGARLVTASALFDLVSAHFLEALVKTLQTCRQQNPVGLYAALNYNGLTRWTPAHPFDDVILHAFNQDQRRDKGFGSALGPEAGNAMDRVFTRAGLEVYSASSPWVLDGADHRLASALVDGIAGAVAGHPELDPDMLEDWVRFRQSMVIFGTCIVGHTDLLALPAGN